MTAVDKSLESDIVAVAARVFDRPLETLSLDLTSREVREWDSLGHVMLVEAVESLFGVTFGAPEIVAFQTLRDLCEAVKRHQGDRR